MPTHHLTMHQAAQQLSYGRNKLFKLLRQHGVLCGNNQPKQRWLRAGYFNTELRQRLTSFNQYQPYYVTLVTVAGLGFLRQLIDEQNAAAPSTPQAASAPAAAQRRSRPRHYAAEIVALATRQQRRDALAQVPDHYRDWVRNLVTQTFQRQTFQRRALPIQARQRSSTQR